MANQNLLKNSCLQQQSTTPDTLSFLPPWLPSSSCLLDVLIQGIRRCSVWKSTCKVQNTYNGEPFNVIFNQSDVFFRILGMNILFWLYVLFVWLWMWQESSSFICSSEIASSYYFRPNKVMEHVTSWVSGGKFKTK